VANPPSIKITTVKAAPRILLMESPPAISLIKIPRTNMRHLKISLLPIKNRPVLAGLLGNARSVIKALPPELLTSDDDASGDDDASPSDDGPANELV
jgi:hypothetical protein